MSLSGKLDYMKKTVLKMNDKKKQLCIVTGVGPEKGTGAEIAKYFSKKNYIVAMIARNSENLFNLEKKYNNSYKLYGINSCCRYLCYVSIILI